jgi:catechol 1,2-dioxygenase
MQSDIHPASDTLDQTRAQRTAKDPTGKEEDTATFSAVLGPFYRAGVPVQPNGTTIIRQEEPGAPYTHLFGVIYDHQGKPLPNALVDIWHDAVRVDLVWAQA